MAPPRRPGRPPLVKPIAETATDMREDPRDDNATEIYPETQYEPRDLRGSPREEDPRARAARRAAELRSTVDLKVDEADEFYVDPDIIPDGWTYEWKRFSVLGQEDTGAMLTYRRAGWEEVPMSRHPEMMPLGSVEHFIMRKGMVLMERPQVISQDFEDRMLRKARQQVSDKEAEAKGGAYANPDAGFEARGNKIGHSYEAMPIPD